MTEKEKGKLVSAAWSAISAAWVSDDSGGKESAQKCRKMAVQLIRDAKSQNQRIAKPSGADEAIIVDLLRRSAQLEEALRITNSRSSRIRGSVIRKVLEFQKDLISRSDVSTRTVSEAIEES